MAMFCRCRATSTPPRRIVALLFLRASDEGGPSLPEALRQYFGLTPAEARLALAE